MASTSTASNSGGARMAVADKVRAMTPAQKRVLALKLLAKRAGGKP